mgnify:CR=1 FL=1
MKAVGNITHRMICKGFPGHPQCPTPTEAEVDAAAAAWKAYGAREEAARKERLARYEAEAATKASS